MQTSWKWGCPIFTSVQVFRPRTPPEAIALCSRLLEYTPTARLTPLEACAHSFFDELRDPNIKLPNGREKPSLFNFTTQGRLTCKLELIFCFFYLIDCICYVLIKRLTYPEGLQVTIKT